MANSSGNPQIELAIHYYEMGRYETAEGLFSDLIANEPQNPRFLYYFARCLMLQNKENEKVEEIYRFLLVDAQYGFGSNIELAEFYYAHIIQEYRANIIKTLKSSRVPFVDQLLILKKTRIELEKKVLPLIDESARLNPNNCIVYATYSKYYSACRRFKKAKMFLAKAKEIDHQNSRVIQAEIALAARNKKNSDEAETVSNILNSNMTEFRKLIMISLAYNSTKNYKKAYEYAKQAYLMSPADKNAITLLKQFEYLCRPINLFFTFIYKRKIYLSSFAVLLAVLIAYVGTELIFLNIPLIILLIYIIGYRLYLANVSQKLNKMKKGNL